jgi:hypothetical protein
VFLGVQATEITVDQAEQSSKIASKRGYQA